jgi:hypothetical protein|tara:strand:+ start:1316 stop:1528 length:213 start_codon:yes stop_codon:yes gene_type:complete
MGALFGGKPKDKTASLLAQQRAEEKAEDARLENVRLANIKRRQGGLSGTIMTSGQGVTEEADVSKGYLLG